MPCSVLCIELGNRDFVVGKTVFVVGGIILRTCCECSIFEAGAENRLSLPIFELKIVCHLFMSNF